MNARRIPTAMAFLAVPLLAVTSLLALTPGTAPDDPFSKWKGTWEGEFICYDIEGHERYRLKVHQKYEFAGADQQSGVFTNRLADGTVETLHAVNLVRDGKLICRVRKIGTDGKPTGDIVEHAGRYIGPGHIIWHRKLDGVGFETFNETVEGSTYRIHGVGLYNDNPRDMHIFEGTYRRVED